MVVGQDGAGKSCLIDSFLDRPFNAQSPSTDGAAIHMAVTAAKGRVGQHTWREEKCENAQHLDKYLAAGYVITKKQDQVITLHSHKIAFDLISMLGKENSVEPDPRSFFCKKEEDSSMFSDY